MDDLPPQNVGVVGAGTIGETVAQDLAPHRCVVVLVDVSAQALDRARRDIEKNVRFYRLFSHSGGDSDPARVLARIEFTTELERLADVPFVIENVTEDFDVKSALYARLHAVCRPDAVLAAN